MVMCFDVRMSVKNAGALNCLPTLLTEFEEKREKKKNYIKQTQQQQTAKSISSGLAPTCT